MVDRAAKIRSHLGWLTLDGKRRVHMAVTVWKCLNAPDAPVALLAAHPGQPSPQLRNPRRNLEHGLQDARSHLQSHPLVRLPRPNLVERPTSEDLNSKDRHGVQRSCLPPSP